MKRVAGWWCPDLLSGPGNYLARWERLAAELQTLGLFSKQRKSVAVQAGGHIGTYPVSLCQHFDWVYTFEPDAQNFACLARNISDSVFPMRAALGQDHGCVGLAESKRSTGQHQLLPGNGAVPVIRIDDLQLAACDAVLLDVEGFEIPALMGARKTLLLHRPLVVAEENKRCRTFGYQLGDLEVHMRLVDYRLAARSDEDLIFLPR